ncbi:hypothetical protein [Actinokineospora sp. NPDC004072]
MMTTMLRLAKTRQTAAPGVWVMPEGFRFSDENPVTGLAYARSRFDDLPGYAQRVVESVLDLAAWRWDRLVGEGEAYSVAGVFTWYPITDFLALVAERNDDRTPPSARCHECWDTLVVRDSDGSMTGRVGAGYLCPCARGAASVNPAHAGHNIVDGLDNPEAWC